MSHLPEHSDLEDLTADDHSQYLLLTAGSGRPLSGDLYFSGSSPNIYMRPSASAVNYTRFYALAQAFYLRHHRDSGDSEINVDPMPDDGSSDATVSLFDATTTTGDFYTNWYKTGVGSNLQHQIINETAKFGDVNGGDYVSLSPEGVVLPYLSGAPASPVNGQMWMESDGLHIYYAGAEKVVAGV